MPFDKQKATLQEWFDAVSDEPDQRIKEEKRFFLLAKTAVGSGSLEEQLLRLMVWTGTYLHSGSSHTKIRRPLDILRVREAWCDQQAKVFLFFALHLLGLSGREIAVYHSDGANGHTVCEMFYDGAWHLFDIHSEHQSIYRTPDGRIASYEELKAHPELVEQASHWWKGRNGEGKVGFYRGGGAKAIMDNFTAYNESTVDW
jgi:hypothetical protein